MTTNWIEQFNQKFPHKIAEVIDDFGSPLKSDLQDFITTLLEKQRGEIQDKLNKHWDKLETNDYDFKDMENWRIFKCIRNNNNDVIKSHDNI